MTQPTIKPEEKQAFEDDGFFVVPGLLNISETKLLRKIAKADRALETDRSSRADGEGGAVELVVRNELPTDTIYGAIVRSCRVVERMNALLCQGPDDAVYHYHHKMICKEPRTGGAWAWHQDYGYWYNFGCLMPTMASCLIAVDRATEENGCLQVLRGSHRIGRIDHGPVGEQTGADPERVAVACERFERVYVELEPGDAVFFHANLLHRSDQNHSENPRWAFICCYNTRSNNPYKQSRHPQYTELEIWEDELVHQVGEQHWGSTPTTV